ncbi:LCP family protein [Cohnella faecalis]|uniref:LytR family transcriptional regulator n=1 Tax=Cohnella faecalis TaxID=2315694 RepID=A0A398CRC3_9BACL|nr:LCP family protein [Cohnella faecalis]RIE01464.1 LytR family transcriptional regulator [Cohnella faecalis]
MADKVEKQLADSYHPLDNRPSDAEPPQAQATEPFSMLIMGVDARKNERGRSDTLIYTVVRPKDGNVLMISIPRDTYADIVGKDKKDKITHSYVYGGPEMAVATVEKLLDAKVEHYASINFQGFVEVVNTLGGISLPITKDLVNDDPGHEKFVVKANQSSYDGKDALNYVRYREDAGGDVSRTERNREFIESIIRKTASLKQWSKIPEVLGIVGDNFRTDLAPESMSDLTKQFLQVDHRIQSYTLKGVGKRMGPSNLWYFVADEDDLTDIRQTIAAWMNADTPVEQLKAPGQKKADSADKSAKVPA